jgi:SH3-like domain-containing protein
MAALCAVLRARAESFVVTGDNVNLRSAPEGEAEVVGQVSAGEILESVELEGEWLGVKPPDRVDVWVYGELITDGHVAVPKLRVRSGPGINYRPVGTLSKGTPVSLRGTNGEWSKIAPVPGCILWVSRGYVRPVGETPCPTGPVQSRNPALAVQRMVVPPVRKPPMPAVKHTVREVVASPARTEGSTGGSSRAVPTTLQGSEHESNNDRVYIRPDVLVPRDDQGRTIALRGTVRKAAWVWRRPSRYCLVDDRGPGRPVTRCYLVADDAFMSNLEGEPVEITGREYLVQGVRLSAVVVETVAKLPASGAGE